MINEKDNGKTNNHTGRWNNDHSHGMAVICKCFITYGFKQPIDIIKNNRNKAYHKNCKMRYRIIGTEVIISQSTGDQKQSTWEYKSANNA